MINKINQVIDHIINFMAVVARILLIVITLLVFIDIISSKFLNQPISWVFEINEYSLLFITFLGVAFVLRSDEHIKLDLILNILSKKQREIVEIINSFIGLIITVIVSATGLLAVKDLFMKKVITEGAVHFPRFVIVAIVPIGLVFVAIQFLRNIFRNLKEEA